MHSVCVCLDFRQDDMLCLVWKSMQTLAMPYIANQVMLLSLSFYAR